MHTMYGWLFSPNWFSTKGEDFVFPWYFTRTKYEVESLLCLSYHGDFLDILGSRFSFFRYTQRSLMYEYCGAVSAL